MADVRCLLFSHIYYIVALKLTQNLQTADGNQTEFLPVDCNNRLIIDDRCCITDTPVVRNHRHTQ